LCATHSQKRSGAVMKRDYLCLGFLITAGMLLLASIAYSIFAVIQLAGISSNFGVALKLNIPIFILIMVLNALVCGASVGYYVLKRKNVL
jgi:hypothetical protein